VPECNNVSPESKTSTVSQNAFHSVILDFSSVTIIDYVGIKCLRQVII
jgi:anti-anti-sigma regulatory factor